MAFKSPHLGYGIYIAYSLDWTTPNFFQYPVTVTSTLTIKLPAGDNLLP